MSVFDPHKNFAVSLVATAPSPATSGTLLTVTAGQGSLFPAVQFNAVVCPAGSLPTAANAEIVRVTSITTDTFAITRAQEGSSARAIVVGDQIFVAPTAKTFTDIEALGSLVAYTPTWNNSGTPNTLGNGSISGTYTQIGKLVVVRIRLVWGSTTTSGSGAWSFSTPVADDGVGFNPSDGFAQSHLGPIYPLLVLGPTQASPFVATSPVATLTATSPFTWTTGDVLLLGFVYFSI